MWHSLPAMAQESGRQVLGAAVIVGLAVVGGALVLANSLNQMTERLDQAATRLEEIRTAVADAKEALANLPSAAPQAAARRGPDPNRRYTVKADGSPAKGPAKAAITVVEFSDFQ